MRKILTLPPRVGTLDTRLGRPIQATKRMRGGNLQRRNRRMFMRNPLCVMCQAEGKTTEAQVWDHIMPLSEGGCESEANLQGLCIAHHNIKSAIEADRRSRY